MISPEEYRSQERDRGALSVSSPRWDRGSGLIGKLHPTLTYRALSLDYGLKYAGLS
jgi:hypothetical protein